MRSYIDLLNESQENFEKDLKSKWGDNSKEQEHERDHRKASKEREYSQVSSTFRSRADELDKKISIINKEVNIPPNTFDPIKGKEILINNLGPERGQTAVDFFKKKYHQFGWDATANLLLCKLGSIVRVIDPKTGEPASFGYQVIGSKYAQLGSGTFDWRKAFKNYYDTSTNF